MTPLEKLFTLEPSDKVRTLDLILRLSASFKHPHNNYPSIHVAGTNGKGSTCFKIAKVLELSGYRVGLYTSPHLFHVSERIQINGKRIPLEDLEEILQEVFQKEKNLTFFEAMTITAFEYFLRENVDIAVIETGLGGRLDATNIILPILSVITSIGLDHTEILGESIAEIALEKAGIIKKNIPLVIPKEAFLAPIEKIAQELNAPVHLVDTTAINYDEKNTVLAKEVLRVLGIPLEEEALLEGLQSRPPCRLQIEGNVVLDVAHNPHGIAQLLETLEELFPNKKKRIVCGFSKHKDIEQMVSLIQQKAVGLHLAPFNSKKSASSEELKRFSTASLHESMGEAIEKAFTLAEENKEILVITGSFYLMQEAQEVLKKTV